jgi:hypothetical protein
VDVLHRDGQQLQRYGVSEALDPVGTSDSTRAFGSRPTESRREEPECVNNGRLAGVVWSHEDVDVLKSYPEV